MHPRYSDLVTLLDAAISRLLLRPTLADATLDTIMSLLLYLQWMPRGNTRSMASGSLDSSSATKGGTKTRYNDMSAWAVFGLSLRYASFMGLDRKALTPFLHGGTASAITTQDVDSMRVWLNLVTYDCNLTLTSGLPSSLDPEKVPLAARNFCSHQASQEPGDLRYASLTELACIVQRVVRHKAGNVDRDQAVAQIKKANVDLDDWERCVMFSWSLAHPTKAY